VLPRKLVHRDARHNVRIQTVHRTNLLDAHGGKTGITLRIKREAELFVSEHESARGRQLAARERDGGSRIESLGG